MKRLVAALVIGLCALGAAAGPIQLVKDINRTVAPAGPPIAFGTSSIAGLCGASGCGPWIFDGTEAGSSLVKNIDTDPAVMPRYFTAVGARIFFVDVSSGKLWVTDATAAGTAPVAGMYSSPSAPIAVVGSDVYANNLTGALLKIDGATLASTQIHSGGRDPVAAGGLVFFTVQTGFPNNAALWRTDGTPAGTYSVTSGSAPVSLLPGAGDRVYFRAPDPGTGQTALWVSDGTVAGTVMTPLPTEAGYFVAGSLAYAFDSNTVWPDVQLLRTDGTPAGTVMLGTLTYTFTYPTVVAVGTDLYFASTVGGGSELWKSDGTAVGTFLVKHVNAYPIDSMVAMDGGLYFTTGFSPDATVWKTLGTEATTQEVLTHTNLVPWGSFGNVIGFNRDQQPQLWISDAATPSAVQPFKAAPGQPTNDSATCSAATAVLGGFAYFFADDGEHGCELWRSDATGAGTTLVKDIYPGLRSGAPLDGSGVQLVALGGRVYFAADDGVNGLELWASDGTEAGTVLVKDILPGVYSGAPGYLTALGSNLLFAGVSYPQNLWVSDGTTAGTTIIAASTSLNLRKLTRLGGLVFYIAGANELWRTDGTEAGTFKLPLPAGALVSDLVAGTSQVYFIHGQGSPTGNEVWRTDGTVAGTRMIVDAGVGTLDGAVSIIGVAGDRLVYNGHLGPIGSPSGVIGTDGTPAGTVLIPGPAYGDAWGNARQVDGNLYYFGGPNSLWKTDGTGAPAQGILGLPATTIATMETVRGSLFFLAPSGSSGAELLTSSGVVGAPSLVDDYVPGNAGMRLPNNTLRMVELPGGTLLFAGGNAPGIEPLFLAFDVDPAPITFAAASNVLTNSTITSAPVAITGIDVAVPVTATGGVVCVSSAAGCSCDLEPYAATASANFGQYLCVRHFSAPTSLTTTTTTLTVGSASTSFSSTTGAVNPTTFSFASATAALAENGSTTLTVERAGSASGEVSVGWATVNGSAIAGEDFGTPGVPAPVTGTLTWGDGDLSPRTIVIGGPSASIPILDDNLYEPQASFQVQLASPSPGAVIAGAIATVSIVDDDTQVEFVSATLSVNEFEIGANPWLSVVRSGRIENVMTVNWSTSNGTAIAGADFGVAGSPAQIGGTVTFAAGETTRLLTVGSNSASVLIIPDANSETDETFFVTLSSPSAGLSIAAKSQATVTIVGSMPTVSMANGAVAASEAAGVAQLTVTRGGTTGQAVSVNYATVNGTALAGTHYQGTYGTLTWTAFDATPKVISVPLVNDASAPSFVPSFQVILSSPVGASLLSPIATTVAIADDDSTVAFTAAAATVTEGGGPLRLTVTRTGVRPTPLTVYWHVDLGTAVPGDFASPTTGLLSWAGDDTSSRTIEIAIANDSVPEIDKAFHVVLDPPALARLGAIASVAVTLKDDDSGVVFANPTHTVSESGGNATLQVQRVGPSLRLGATVGWSTSNDSAIAGQDFGTRGSAAQRSGTLSWGPGDMTPKSIVIPILQDTLSEGLESFKVTLGSPAGGIALGEPKVATVRIVDDDPAPRDVVSFAQPKFLVMENAGHVDVVLKRTPLLPPATGTIYVWVTGQAGTALETSDFENQGASIGWLDGDVSDKFFRINIKNDSIKEGPESFKVLMSPQTAGVQIGTPETAVTILDDDDAFPPRGAVPSDWAVPAAANAGWHASSDPGAFEGVYSLRSDAIEHGQVAQVEVTRVFAAGNVAFRVKVSSEPNFDKLRFFVDGVEKGSWSGTAVAGWTLFTTPLTAGSHTLRWSYEKDGSASLGSDAAWIDAVALP